MKILYGIQGTGNGHISRARMMAKYFQENNADVTFLLSGRKPEKLFDREFFGDLQHRQGLTFAVKNGNIDYIKTAAGNNIFRLIQDIRKLETQHYDLVISDFEPVTAWAAKLRKTPVLTIGHQYAFDHKIPLAGDSMVTRFIMKIFTPAQTRVGLHWHHFDSDILPPIVDPLLERAQTGTPHTLIYLPFENQQRVTEILNTFKDHAFIQYSPDLNDSQQGNVQLRKTCLDGFKRDLCSANGVISNAGFELISECLYLGIPVLAKPLHGQMEQLSNAKALSDLGYATTMDTLNPSVIGLWLNAKQEITPFAYPNVAKELVEWILNEQAEPVRSLKNRLWESVSAAASPTPVVSMAARN